jgi:hypothetical protein
MAVFGGGSGRKTYRRKKKTDQFDKLSEEQVKKQKREYVETALEQSTLRNYRQQELDYMEYCQHKGVSAWPARMSVIEDFTVHLLYAGLCTKAVKVWSGIVNGNERRQLGGLVKSFELKRLHTKALKLNAGKAGKLRDPMEMAAVRDFCKRRPSSMSEREWTMAKAVITIGIRSLFRAGEIAKLCLRHVSFTKLGADSREAGKIDIGTRKDPRKRAAPVWIEASTRGSLSCPVKCLKDFMAMRRKESAKIVDGCGQDDTLFTSIRGAKLSGTMISSFVREVMKGHQGKFSGHSLRVTGACVMMMAKFDTTEIQVMGDWKTDIFLRYLRTLGIAAKDATDKMGF